MQEIQQVKYQKSIEEIKSKGCLNNNKKYFAVQGEIF